MRIRRFLLGMTAALCAAANAHALIIIPTNLNGADTEVRESAVAAAGELDPEVRATGQYGASTELATRGLNTNTTAANDRSSIMYMKFDISGLPNHNSDPGFWSSQKAFFKITIRNTNLTDARLRFPAQTTPGYPATYNLPELARVKFDIRGLEPGHVYADDDANAANRTDRSGNPYTAAGYKYNWTEGVGTGANNLTSGITFVDAPGLTPHCMTLGACGDANGDTDPNNIYKTLGVYDDFNSDARYLGTWEWPLPVVQFNSSNRYPIGMPIEYQDPNGNLRQLIFDAQDANRTSVTLMMNLAVDTQLDTTSTSTTDGPGPGMFPANTMLNHNYLVNPKEKTTLDNDNSWDSDGAGPLAAVGSPFSCNGSATNSVCNGDGTPLNDTVFRTLGDNSAGAFSPQLIIRVPEPASAALLGLGMLMIGGLRRRK